MLNLKKRRPWVGSAVFVLAIAGIFFALFYLPLAAPRDVSVTVRLACLALGFAWIVEGVRQLSSTNSAVELPTPTIAP